MDNYYSISRHLRAKVVVKKTEIKKAVEHLVRLFFGSIDDVTSRYFGKKLNSKL